MKMQPPEMNNSTPAPIGMLSLPNMQSGTIEQPANAGLLIAQHLEMRPTESLKPHPSLLKQNLQPTAERILALERVGGSIFEQPLLITDENLIVDGYARWLIAKRTQRSTILCQPCQLTEQEALQRILQTHRRPEWLSSFSRVQLALELESWFRAQARANQSSGGKEKVLSKLTEDRRLNCRKQIAQAAGVSTGNVTKVKQILHSGISRQGIEALRSGEIRIHRGWQLSKLSIREQEAELGNLRIKKRSIARIWRLLSRHNTKNAPQVTLVRHIIRGLTELKNIPWLSQCKKQIDDLIAAIEHQFSTGRSESNADQTHPKANLG